MLSLATVITGEWVFTQCCRPKPLRMISVIHKLPIDQSQLEIRSKSLKGIVRLWVTFAWERSGVRGHASHNCRAPDEWPLFVPSSWTQECQARALLCPPALSQVWPPQLSWGPFFWRKDLQSVKRHAQTCCMVCLISRHWVILSLIQSFNLCIFLGTCNFSNFPGSGFCTQKNVVALKLSETIFARPGERPAHMGVRRAECIGLGASKTHRP